jgi:hypothetical protein
MRRTALFFAMIATTCLLAQDGRRRDAPLTDIATPQPGYQVISNEQIKQIYTQEQAMTDIKERLNLIETSLKEIRADVKVLTETNTIIRFLETCFEILIPGLCITAFGVWFGVWFTDRLRKTKPRKPRQHGSVTL